MVNVIPEQLLTPTVLLVLLKHVIPDKQLLMHLVRQQDIGLFMATIVPQQQKPLKPIRAVNVALQLVIQVVMVHTQVVLLQGIEIRLVAIADILQKQFILMREVLHVHQKHVIPVEQLRILLVRPDIELLPATIAVIAQKVSINLRHLVVQP